ncbi:MAG: SH3 domain-containing protein [Gemmatimonadales bacterium]
MAAPPKAAPAPKPVVAAAPDSTPTRAERTPAPPVATVAVAVPAPAPAKPASTPATPPAPVTRIAAPAPARNERATVQGIARYASTWINVRSARSSQAPVVRVLKPGEAVHVDSLAEGWYQVVTTDAVQGYADRRLLSDEVPVNR